MTRNTMKCSRTAEKQFALKCVWAAQITNALYQQTDRCKIINLENLNHNNKISKGNNAQSLPSAAEHFPTIYNGGMTQMIS